MYVRREAVLTSQIEGTQSTLDDVLAVRNRAAGQGTPEDVEEVVNYVSAMNYGLDRLDRSALAAADPRDPRTAHAGTRGGNNRPGSSAASQNWIGAGTTPGDGDVRPTAESTRCTSRSTTSSGSCTTSGLGPLIMLALAHAQFETIHPFLDGNGRVGRLLITFLLCHARCCSSRCSI